MPNTRLYWLHTLSPTHAGIGRGVGYIDLPIDRDGVTGWPIIRGSSFKGVWADHYGQQLIPEPGEDNGKAKDRRKLDTPEGRLLKAAFGTAGENNNSNAGALIPTDARLVCLPIRSFRGTFAWATSSLCLQMLRRMLVLARGELGTSASEVPNAPASLDAGKAHHTKSSVLVEGNSIYLEDLGYTAQECDTAKAWAELIAENVFAGDTAWQEQFKKRFVVLPDTDFDFLCETGTEVHTRVRIQDDTKTVAKGALWSEESLPAETILMGVIQCERVFQKGIDAKELLGNFTQKELQLQIGGKATVGRGQVRCIFTEVK